MKDTAKILVCGAGGFIGWHLVKSLKQKGFYVIGTDIKYPEFESTLADEFYLRDLTDPSAVDDVFCHSPSFVYQLAANMGGAGYIFNNANDTDILVSSTRINLNVSQAVVRYQVPKLFFSSSACVYPQHLQTASNVGNLRELDAYPANPDSEYGWEKLYAERLYLSLARNYSTQVRIARLHNVFGPLGSWQGGKEKAPAALCRKVAETSTGEIEIWGDGNQTRSFLYVDDCIEGIHRIMDSNVNEPINLGSSRKISINDLVGKIADISKKQIQIEHIDGFVGVSNRNSDNTMIRMCLGWEPLDNLDKGLEITYNWIAQQLAGVTDKKN